ncbi:MAG: beta-N-acetylhexosaminidase [Spirochaetota bacterium]
MERENIPNIPNIQWNSIVPQPQQLELLGGSIRPEQLRIELNEPFSKEIAGFASRHEFLAGTGSVPLRVCQESRYGAEGYRIEIRSDAVMLRAGSPAGAFYATMTLSQWLWQHSALPQAIVEDRPRFTWRGYMLDVSRHFFPLSYVKELMRQLASYKINRFHIHLSDDQGWRLAIEQYPKLAELGSKRYDNIDHYYTNSPADRGFYSKQDIRELHDLGEKLHISIVPEIDLPGHATAAIACYPELMCDTFRDEALKIQPIWGISRNVLCLAKPETWDFVYAVLDEVAEMFPAPFVHLGGDEVPRHHWENCPDCQKMVCEEGLGNCDGLQNLFTQRSRDYLLAKGKTPLYWDEVEESGLSEGTVCCFWRSWTGSTEERAESWDIRAASKGVPVISCPVNGAYLDYKHSHDPNEGSEPAVLSVYDSYHFAPLADKRPDLAPLNWGVQANLWSERIATPRQAEYMSFPRVLAIAEQGWNKGGWSLFRSKWDMQQRVLAAQGVRNYYRGPWNA